MFQLLVMFWILKAFLCVKGYFDSGVTGMLSALAHGGLAFERPIPDHPAEWDTWAKGHPRWDLLILRLLTIALVTLALGLLNRRTLRKFWRGLFHGPEGE